jgi:hypothetical protein
MNPMKKLGSFQLLLTLFVTALSASFSAHAQTPRSPASPFVDATSGGGPVDLLSQPWLFHIGSDPTWAAPTLDDSHWVRVSKGVPLRTYGSRDTETYWYRFHIRLRPNAHDLALYFITGGTNVAVYANGQLIGQNGGVIPGSALNGNLPPPISIPNRITAAAHGDLTVALHVYAGALAKVDPGLFDYKDDQFTLTTPAEALTARGYHLAHLYAPLLGVAALQVIVALCALFLFFSLRSQNEYLALTVWMFTIAANTTLTLWNNIHASSSFSPDYWLSLALAGVVVVAQIEFVRLITKTPTTRWLLGLEVVSAAVQFVIPLAINGHLPLNLTLAAYFVPVVVSDLVLPILLLRSALRGSLDARLVLVPFVLWSFADFYTMATLFAFTLAHKELPKLPDVHLYSYSIGTNSLFDVLGLICLLLIILTRTTRLAHERASLAAEVRAAEHVQTLLLARASRPTPGYRVETAYRPAGEVGGDFFLVSPHRQDGSLLVIVGDVSGKGMAAAMRVSLILGVLNREQLREPKLILSELNEALRSQGDIGFTTACCVRLESDGRFSFSNAGHLNPYVDGVEVESPGALPLGLQPSPCFDEIHGILQLGERMILLSDGVPEARSGKGELLGFDRLAQITRMTAGEIADFAERFGQKDDITVLALALA